MYKAINVDSEVIIIKKLPSIWTPKVGKDIINFEKSTDKELEDLGIFDVDYAELNKYEKYRGHLIPSDFDALKKRWIMEVITFTKEEIIDYDLNVLDSDESAEKLSKYEEDGELAFRRFWTDLERKKEAGDISLALFKGLALAMFDATLPIKMGFWEVGLFKVKAVDTQGSVKGENIKNNIIGKIEDYILNNY